MAALLALTMDSTENVSRLPSKLLASPSILLQSITSSWYGTCAIRASHVCRLGVLLKSHKLWYCGRRWCVCVREREREERDRERERERVVCVCVCVLDQDITLHQDITL